MPHIRTTDRSGASGDDPRRPVSALELVRIDPDGRNALNFTFRSEAGERSWRLDQTSLVELLALTLGGQIRRRRQVVLPEAEITLEPPGEGENGPSVCMATGLIEVRTPLDRGRLKALKADIERSLKG
ncbi:MAG: hypothetical protein QM773_06475 [Hyphomonadaceae bacterium]